MADEIPSLPWETVASHFTYIYANPKADGVTNLFPRNKPTQAADLNAFVDAFTHAIREHSARERAKYAPSYAGPALEDILIDDETVREISPFFRRVHDDTPTRNPRWDGGVRDVPGCRHPRERKCDCLIPYGERRAEALLRDRRDNSCWDFWDENGTALRSWGLVRTLVIHGKLEPVLRLCAYPWQTLAEWWAFDTCRCGIFEDGATKWHYERLVLEFVCLNILRCMPEIWDPERGRDVERDYRLTKAYQGMIRYLTWNGETSSIPAFAPRDFYGIGDRQYSMFPKPRDEKRWEHLNKQNVHGALDDADAVDKAYPVGRITYEEFLSFEVEPEYLPHADDVAAVYQVLIDTGLPAELAADVMYLADYVPRRRLKVAHDPFHPDNRDELDRYLAECWAVMVRYNVFNQAIDDDSEHYGCMCIDWQGLANDAVRRLCPDLKVDVVPFTCRPGVETGNYTVKFADEAEEETNPEKGPDRGLTLTALFEEELTL